jgi:8-oxo-dGTP diphosphatase
VTSRFRVVPAAYVVFRRCGDQGQQVLLQLRQGTGYMDGYWATAAAGHVEADESVLEAACREVLEELGITVEPTDLRPLCAMHRTGRNFRQIDERVDFFFECWRWSGEPRLLEAGKAVDLQWFELGELPALVVPHERFVLERLNADLPAVVTFGF